MAPICAIYKVHFWANLTEGYTMPRPRKETLTPRKEQFAQAYTRLGNAEKALKEVLGTWTMKPHSLRSRASQYLNDYRVYCRICELIQERKQRGEPMPHYHGRAEFNS